MITIITPKYKNYEPGTQSFSAGLLGPRGNVGYFMVADYDTAKLILENIIDAGKPVERAEMGLDGDWGCCSTEIYDGADHQEYDAHGSSHWAEPLMIVYFQDGTNEAYSVWRNHNELNQING